MLSRSSVNCGTVVVGGSTVVTEIISNPTRAAITIQSGTIDGADFQISGSSSFPLTLAPKQSSTVGITFTPGSAGQRSGSLDISLDGQNSYATIPLYGVAVIQGQLATSPAAIVFGAGSGGSVTETVINSGGTNLTITKSTITGMGLTVSGPTLPAMLKPGDSATFAVSLSSAATGNVSGNLRLVTFASPLGLDIRGLYDRGTILRLAGSFVIPVSGSAVPMGRLTTAPSSIAFGSIAVGTAQSQPMALMNAGGGPVTISQATTSGAGFAVSGLNLPMTLSPGESVSFTGVFTPQSPGAVQGNLAVASNASNSVVSFPLSGAGTALGQITLNPSSLNFSSIPIGKTESLTATISASGSSVTVSSASSSSAEFSLGGIQLPLTIPAGQSANFNVIFTPQSSGTASASVAFNTNASQPSVVESLVGAGSAAPQHSVNLSWTADSPAVAGYNVYRAAQTGGPYTKVNSALMANATYQDSTSSSGQTYFYVTTAVDASGAESGNSNEIQATVPSP